MYSVYRILFIAVVYSIVNIIYAFICRIQMDVRFSVFVFNGHSYTCLIYTIFILLVNVLLLLFLYKMTKNSYAGTLYVKTMSVLNNIRNKHNENRLYILVATRNINIIFLIAVLLSIIYMCVYKFEYYINCFKGCVVCIEGHVSNIRYDPMIELIFIFCIYNFLNALHVHLNRFMD